jgi:hypothetical protein
MSTDTLLRVLEQNARTVPQLAQQPRLFAAVTVLEDAADVDHFVLRDILRDHLGQAEGVREVFDLSVHIGGGETYSHGIFSEDGVPRPEVAAAVERFRGFAGRMMQCLARM